MCRISRLEELKKFLTQLPNLTTDASASDPVDFISAAQLEGSKADEKYITKKYKQLMANKDTEKLPAFQEQEHTNLGINI